MTPSFKIIATLAFVCVSAPAFAHGSGHGGMDRGGMDRVDVHVNRDHDRDHLVRDTHKRFERERLEFLLKRLQRDLTIAVNKKNLIEVRRIERLIKRIELALL